MAANPVAVFNPINAVLTPLDLRHEEPWYPSTRLGDLAAVAERPEHGGGVSAQGMGSGRVSDLWGPALWIRTEERANLYVIGYVDYMDRFEGRHRAGYARRYDPWAGERNMIYRNQDGLVERVPDPTGAQNNLPFVTEMAYNEDRLREKGEGNDWDEPPE